MIKKEAKHDRLEKVEAIHLPNINLIDNGIIYAKQNLFTRVIFLERQNNLDNFKFIIIIYENPKNRLCSSAEKLIKAPDFLILIWVSPKEQIKLKQNKGGYPYAS